MTESNNGPDLSNYVSVKEAARMLGISSKRVYAYIESKRLTAFKVGRDYWIPKEAIQQFELRTAGRPRTKTPLWQRYNNSKLIILSIQVQVRPNQQDALIQKLQEIYRAERYLFTGSVQRYILRDVADPTSIEISIVWKDTDMPDEAVREQELAAFKAELADVLDWDTARYSYKEGIIYT